MARKTPGLRAEKVGNDVVLKFYGDAGPYAPPWAEVVLVDGKKGPDYDAFIKKINDRIAANRSRED